MTEINNLHNAEDNVLPHSHKRIKAAYQDAVDDCLQEDVHIIPFYVKYEICVISSKNNIP